MEVKKKHHYVWKQYLKSWANEKNQIYFFRKNSSQIKSTNLDNIAQKRFFYEVDSFTESEESILKYLINEWSNDYSRESNLSLLKLFLTYSKTCRQWQNLSFRGKEEKLNVVKKNTLEDLHSMFEKFGHKLLSINNLSDLSIFDKKEEKVKALIYLCIQYTRTNQMHSKAVDNLTLAKLLPESSLKLIAVTFSITLASNLALIHKLKITLLKNTSNIEFITSDQPIINTKANLGNPRIETELLEFYYPLNTKAAILISTSEVDSIVENVIAVESEIKKYNNLLLKSSPDFVFSRTEDSLKLYEASELI